MFQKYYQQFIRSGNLYSLMGNMLFALFNLATFLLLVRTLEKEIFGQWVLFLTIASMLDLFRIGLSGTATIRLMARANEAKKNAISASSYFLGFSTTIILSVLFLTLYATGRSYFDPNNPYLLVLLFYPLLSIANLPYHQASTVTQGNINFKRLMLLKAMNGGFCLIVIGTYTLSFPASLNGIAIVYILANAFTSLVTILLGWDKLLKMGKASKTIMSSILKFGKYSTASSLGSSLLRSSDTILLGMASFLGPEAIAIYAIPLKFVEAVEIPLRSFTATAYPRLSQALEKGKNQFIRLLGNYTLGSVFLLLPVAALLLSFPAFFLGLIGGETYSENIEVQTNILYVICIYIVLLPLDRYSGVALFAIDKPNLNFHKIAIMLMANILFDLIAIYIFQSLFFVALATLFFTLIGIVIGWIMLFNQSKAGIKETITFLKAEIPGLYRIKT